MAKKMQQEQLDEYPSEAKESRLALIKQICERLFMPDLDELDLDSWGIDDD